MVKKPSSRSPRAATASRIAAARRCRRPARCPTRRCARSRSPPTARDAVLHHRRVAPHRARGAHRGHARPIRWPPGVDAAARHRRRARPTAIAPSTSTPSVPAPISSCGRVTLGAARRDRPGVGDGAGQPPRQLHRRHRRPRQRRRAPPGGELRRAPRSRSRCASARPTRSTSTRSRSTPRTPAPRSPTATACRRTASLAAQPRPDVRARRHAGLRVDARPAGVGPTRSLKYLLPQTDLWRMPRTGIDVRRARADDLRCSAPSWRRR